MWSCCGNSNNGVLSARGSAEINDGHVMFDSHLMSDRQPVSDQSQLILDDGRLILIKLE